MGYLWLGVREGGTEHSTSVVMVFGILYLKVGGEYMAVHLIISNIFFGCPKCVTINYK